MIPPNRPLIDQIQAFDALLDLPNENKAPITELANRIMQGIKNRAFSNRLDFTNLRAVISHIEQAKSKTESGLVERITSIFTGPDLLQVLSQTQSILKIETFKSAVCTGELQVIQELLETVPISEEDRNWAVRKASQQGHFAVVEALFADGATISEDARGWAIREASENGHLAIIQVLLAKGDPISEKNRGLAIIAATLEGHLNIIQALLANGAISEQNRNFAVKSAARQGQLDIVKALLSSAPISEDMRGLAVKAAAKYGRLDIVQIYLADGQIITERDRGLAVIESAVGGHLNIAQALLNNGPISGEKRGLALKAAAKHGHLNIIQALLANDAIILERDRGFAVLSASEYGHLNIVQALLANGPISEDMRGSSIQLAAGDGHLQIIQILLANGGISRADRDAAISIASENEYINVAQLLALVVPSADPGLLNAIDFWQTRSRFHEPFNFSLLNGQPYSDSLKNFLGRLKEVKDFKNSTEAGRGQLANRVFLILKGMLENEKFKELAFVQADEALSRCADRITLGLNSLEVLYHIHIGCHGQTASQLATLGVGLKRLDLIRQKTAELHATGGDSVETELFLQLKLKEALNLPINTEGMLYSGMSRATDADIPAILEQIKARTSTKEDVVQLLVDQDFWKDHLRSENLDRYVELADLERYHGNEFAMAEAIRNQYVADTTAWFEANQAPLASQSSGRKRGRSL